MRPPPPAGRAPPTRSDWQHGAAGCQAAKTPGRAGRAASAPVTQALTDIHAGHLISWFNLSAAALRHCGQRLYSPSPRADWWVRVGGPSQPEQARNLKGHSDTNAVQASVLWIIASDEEMSAFIFHSICYLIRKRVPSYIKCLLIFLLSDRNQAVDKSDIPCLVDKCWE